MSTQKLGVRENIKEEFNMNRKIISVLMAAAMLSSVTAMAENDIMPISTEGIEAGDVILISETPLKENKFTGEVTAISENMVTVAIEFEGLVSDYTFGLAEGVELGDIKEGDKVEVTTTANLMTKDIKEAKAITKVIGEADAETDLEASEVTVTYNRYMGKVSAVADGIANVTIEQDGITADYGFGVTNKTPIYTIDGEEAKEVKAGDSVIVVSSSGLMTKDIKAAEAIVITNDESISSVHVDTFKMEEESLISADGELVLNMENAAAYDGKKLLVFYDFATMSIPAQTNPLKVVVLEEQTEKVSVSFKVGDSILNINGVETEVETPYVVGVGVTLVPIRVISEAFGAEVIWDGETKTVTVIDDETTVVIQIENKTAMVNGEEKTLEEAPELTGGGFTMIPLRFISENLGATVTYDNETAAITVER